MTNIPNIGLGTWQLKGASGKEVILNALDIGYRHIDTADWYRNHDIVGDAILESGIRREDIYLVTKVYPPLNSNKIYSDAQRFLNELKTEYLDLILVHWPDSHPISEVVSSMGTLISKGICKQVGVSNFNVDQLKVAIDTKVLITNHQFEAYFGHLDEDVYSFCSKNNISMTAYSPLGQGSVLQNKFLKNLADKSNASIAQVALKYLLLRGFIIIPKASSITHLRDNFNSTSLDLKLSDFQ